MTKENVLFGIIGLLLGCIVGFIFANTMNQHGFSPAPTALATSSPNLPPGHPATGQTDTASDQPAAAGPQPPEIAAKIKKAKDEPANFDAQMDAAKLYYAIQRLPEAIEYLQKAQALKPKDFETLAGLGNAYFDSNNFTEAERWYRQALVVKPDSIEVRTDLGTTFMSRTPPDLASAIREYQASLKLNPNHEQTLGNLARAYAAQGNLADAQSMLNKLAQVNPNNADLPQLRTELQKVGVK